MSGADPRIYAVSLQMTVINPAVGCYHFPIKLPSQLQDITVFWPVPYYTAWWRVWTTCPVSLRESAVAEQFNREYDILAVTAPSQIARYC